jgi:hypothetical protein
MNLNELLPNGGIEALASQLGVPPEQARRGAEALLPSVLGGMGDKSAELDTHVNALGGAGLAQNVVGPEPTQIDKGNQLLGGIFGSKDVSRQVAGNAAQSSGLDPALLKRMLPFGRALKQKGRPLPAAPDMRSLPRSVGLGGFLLQRLADDRLAERPVARRRVACTARTGGGEYGDSRAAHICGQGDRHLHDDRHRDVVERGDLVLVEAVVENVHVGNGDVDQPSVEDLSRRRSGDGSGAKRQGRSHHDVTHYISPESPVRRGSGFAGTRWVTSGISLS